MNNLKSSLWKVIGPFVIGIVIIVVAFRHIGISEIVHNLLSVNIYLYLLAVGCIFFSILSWTVRWEFFLEANGRNVPTFGLFKYLLVGLAVNNLSPFGRFGGEPVRAYLLKKTEGVKMREGLASILAELTIFFIVMMAFIILSIFLFPLLMDPPRWLMLTLLPFGIVTALILFGIIGIYSGGNIIIRIIKWLGKKIERLQPYEEKLLSRYYEFQKNFRKCLANKKAFSGALTSAIVSRMFNIAKFLLIFTALGFEISLLKVFIGMGISLIILSLPTTPGSIGVYEGGFISIFALLGVPPQIAATAVFLDRLIWFWGLTIIGGTLGTYYGINILKSDKHEKT